MPPNNTPAPRPFKPYFFYGHRKPSQNRPVVRGSLFSSRKTIPARQSPIHLHKWDLDHHSPIQSPPLAPEPPSSLAASRRLSPIARFIVDAFRRNRGDWSPPVVAELGKLRRVTPSLVAEVLKAENNPAVASKFFAWAGGKVESACGLLKDLIDSGYRVELGICNSLIEGLCSVKQVDKAHKLFFITLRKDLQPDFGKVNPILISYAEMRRIEDFSKLLMQMEKLGYSVRNDLSNFFSSFVCEEERIRIALYFFRDLKIKCYCSMSIYNILMGALKKSGEVKLVMSLFDEMKNNQIEPDSST